MTTMKGKTGIPSALMKFVTGRQSAQKVLAVIAMSLFSSTSAVADIAALLNEAPPADEMRAGVKISGEDGAAANLVLTAYSDRAAKLYRPFLDHATLKNFSATTPFLLIFDTKGQTAPGRIIDVKYDDPDRIIDPMVTTVAVPPNSDRTLQLPYWPVPGYGVIWARADNAGRGYRLDKPGLLLLNLNYEFARSHLRVALERSKILDGQVAPTVRRTLDEAVALLESARAATGAERARLADESLAKTLIAGDDLELAIARQNIPAARMGKLTVRIQGANGKAVEDVKVSYRQTSHDFLFGVVESFGFLEAKPGKEGFKRLFSKLRAAGFNHFTASMFWDQVEKAPGQYQFDDWEAGLGLKQAVDAGLSLKIHAMLQEAVPKHVKEATQEAFSTASKRYFEQTSQRFHRDNGLADAVIIWEAANEPSTNAYASFDHDKKIGLLRSTVKTLREQAPKSKVLINDVYADWGQRWQGKAGKGHHQVISPLEMFAALNQQQVPYDLAGLEWYPGLRVNFFNILQLQGPLMDFASTSLELDRYAALGKPVHITEFAVPASWQEDWKSGWWREKWTPQVQADYAERFYTLAFSKPHIHEISYWGISDNEPWVISGGLMSKSYQSKPIFDRLSALIRSWTSSGALNSDRHGEVVIAGFAGDYELTLEKAGQRTTQKIHIDEQGNGTTTLVLGR